MHLEICFPEDRVIIRARHSHFKTFEATFFVLRIEYGRYRLVEGRRDYPSGNKLDFQKS